MALRSDLDDTQGGTTEEGIHLGAMVGTLDLLHRCFLGIETRNDVIWFNPVLPPEVRSMTVDICYRGRWMNLAVADGSFTVMVSASAMGTARVGLHGEVIELSPGDQRTFVL